MISPLFQGRSLRFRDQEITWAGECPWTGGFCFGTESGELLISRDDDQDDLDELAIKVSEEAVNGVAFWRDRVGVSTRSDVIVARRDLSDDQITEEVKADGGAHGILATPGGRFFAPLGASGVLVVDPDRVSAERLAIEKPRQGILNFYRMIYLKNPSAQDLLACAARTSGLLMIRSDKDNPLEIVGWASPNVDFIDVCSVPSAEWPYAVLGLGLDRSLIFVRDLRAEETPPTLRLGGLRGTPYSILSADGHVFVLTSKELVAFPELLHWCLQGEPWDRPLRYGSTPIQAVDAFLGYGQHLMVVMDEEVRILDIPTLVRPMSDRTAENGHGDLPGWSEGEQPPETAQPSWNHLSLSA